MTRIYKKILTSLLLLVSLLLFAEQERIVSLSPAMTEILFYLGKGDSVVGRTDTCNYPEDAKKIPVAGHFSIPNTETVLSMKPTHVFANGFVNPGQIRIFRNAGITVSVFPCRTLNEYKDCLRQMGEILHAEEKAQAEINRVDELQKNPFPLLSKKVLWIIWDKPLMAAGKNSLPDELIRTAGAENAAENVNTPYFRCSMEWALEHQPDIVIWSASPNGWNTPLLKKCFPCMGKGCIIDDLDPDVLQRPGPRMIDGIRMLHEKLKACQ